MEIKTTFTPSGRTELEFFQRRQLEEIKEFARRRNSYPGNFQVEISAQDIREYFSNLKRQESRSGDLRLLILKLYVFSGVLLTLYGVFFDQLGDLLSDPRKKILIVSGLMIIFLGYLGYKFISIKSNLKRPTEIENEIIRMKAFQRFLEETVKDGKIK